ncbi:hypothetical protein [Aeromonas sp. s3]|uniref:hypothetical protein n=1 Tax=Aeromonas sp. s3 TaxID=3138485 RepID=UPI0034A266E8
MPTSIEIDIFVDGEETYHLEDFRQFWVNIWGQKYLNLGPIRFNNPVNVKEKSGFDSLPQDLKVAFEIRNPDIFFVASIGNNKVALGSIEITVHSPDGSNVEKRYPCIWAGRKIGFTSFVVCPYMKSRRGGQVNKLPNRHSVRNIDFINEWKREKSPKAALHQIIPLEELQDDLSAAYALLKMPLMNWQRLAGYFCDLLAENIKPGSSANRIETFIEELQKLASACKSVTRYTKPSSFMEDGGRWIQIYNTRPDSGHWERGEGQFDSIDGRLMFTLDDAEIKGIKTPIEFWMPQLSKRHPWVMEQVERDHGSKRFRNIVKVLGNYITVKFSDDLTHADLQTLQRNPGLTLERLDWKSGILKIADLLGNSNPEKIARAGLKSPSSNVLDAIQKILSSNTTFISTHRLYEADWESTLIKEINLTPKGSTIIVPRIPKSQLTGQSKFNEREVIFAEDCTKWQLMAIRQLHRQSFE